MKTKIFIFIFASVMVLTMLSMPDMSAFADSPPSIGSLDAPSHINAVRGLTFEVETADPQDMSPAFDTGSISVNAVLFQKDGGGCDGRLNITRIKPQTGYPGGQMTLQYESLFFEERGEVSAEAKAALDGIAGGDNRKNRMLGSVSVCTRIIDHRFTETANNFLPPVDYSRTQTESGEIPFLLVTDEHSATLYLYLHNKAILAIDGTIEDVPPEASLPGEFGKTALYINERALTREEDGVKQMYRLIILAEKSGEGYKGALFYSKAEEKTVMQGVFAKGQTAGQIIEDVEITFAPFEYGAYREDGGHMPEWQTARLSHMATAVCGGQTILLTAAGTEVYAELPGTGFDGKIRGELTDLTPEIKSITDESFALYEAESLYYGDDSTAEGFPEAYSGAMAGFELSGVKLTNEQRGMMEAAMQNMGGMLEGQSKWLPEGFVPVQRPMEGCFLEQPPTSVYGGRFSYTEDSLFVEDILPAYFGHFQNMRDFREKGGDTGGHRSHDIVFRYGNRLFLIDMIDTPVGCAVTVLVL
ncbi:MAG TPA: hypothetical protein VEG39_13865 [Clostridia bacterium]|nr:hypothetical protein [Clostridia bacterium]